MPLSAGELERIAGRIALYLQGNCTLALLLFGSRARATHIESSDYDLLAVTEFPAASVSLQHGTSELDILFATLSQCHTRLQQRSPDNNNFYLNLLAEAEILFDTTGQVASLQSQARTVFKAGPEPMPAAEAVAIARSLRKMLHVIIARIPKVLDNLEGMLLVRMRLDELMSKAIYAVFRVEQRWTQSLFRTVTTMLPDYPELYRRWLAVVNSSPELRAYAEASSALILAACEHVELTSAVPDSFIR